MSGEKTLCQCAQFGGGGGDSIKGGQVPPPPPHEALHMYIHMWQSQVENEH